MVHTIDLTLPDLLRQEVSFPITELNESDMRSDRIFKHMDKHLKTFQVQIIQKLIPNLHQEGYQEIHETEGSVGSSSTTR